MTENASSQIDLLATILTKTASLMTDVSESELDLQTPCEDMKVRDLLNHLATWIQVFDRAANDTELLIDPMTFSLDAGWGEVFERHGRKVIAGLREKGFDRDVTMMTDPMPGSMMMSMLLMEYVAHGWDIVTTIGRPFPYTDAEVAAADGAARSIVQPEHRSPGFFSAEVEAPADATPIERYIAFTGRNPR